MDGGLVRRLERDARVAAVAQAREQRRYRRALARRERQLSRARRALPFHGIVTGAATLVVLLTDGVDWVAGPVAVLSGVTLARAVAVLRSPPATPAPPSALPAAPPPPSPGSVAWPAVLRLERVRAELGRLVPLVGEAGRAAAADAWQAAVEADLALRWQAARLAAVEPHRGAEPTLLGPLLSGVVEQERLVVAVADLVAASDGAGQGGASRLQDAADRLHGLADGLRALR